jgi:hypothetical protein
VAVAMSIRTPPAWSRSTVSSSHPKSYSPSLGSSSAHEKTPSVTRSTPASCINATSSSRTSVGHCSGL